MKTRILVIVSVSLIALSATLSFVACDQAKSLSGLISITPSDSSADMTLTSSEKTLTLTASRTSTKAVTNNVLALPLVWSVTDPSLGTVTSSSGWQAIYQRTTKQGVNTVMVRDQFDTEGYASITQQAEAYEISLTASPGTTLVGPTTNSATICVVETASSQPPYHWWVMDSSLGRVVSAGGAHCAVYKATRAGVNSVHVRDANGIVGTLAIVYDN